MSSFSEVKQSLSSVLSDIGIKDENDFTLVIAGEEIPVVSGRLFRGMHTCADTSSATVINNEKLRSLTNPFGFTEAQVYLAGELVITGLIYKHSPRITAEEKTCKLDIFSPAVDIIDSTHFPPFEFNFVSLEDLAEEIIGGLGLTPRYETDEGNEFFEKVCIDPQQSIFSFFNELANQRGVLITSNEKGEVLFIRANTSGKPVETIDNVTDIGAEYDGRELFAAYRTVAATPIREKITKKLKARTKIDYKTVQSIKEAIAYDSNVPASRQITFASDNVSVDTLARSAEWQRSKKWADALVISVPRVGWRPKGSDELYKENTLVTLKHEDLWIANEFDFLIKSVEYILDSGGATCTLNLIPPQAFTGEEIPDIFGNQSDLGSKLKSLGLDEWIP